MPLDFLKHKQSQTSLETVYILMEEAFGGHPQITREDFEERAKHVIDKLIELSEVE